MVRMALLGIASALLLSISLPAQSEPTSVPSPLEVTIKFSDEQGMQIVNPETHSSVSLPKLEVNIRNVSEKCVVAILLGEQYKDGKGKLSSTGSTAILRLKNGQFNCLAPGQALSHLISGGTMDEFGHALMPEVSVDFVIFGDGSTWGPGKDLEMKGYLRGEFDAYENIQAHKDNPACKANEENPG
jgi:hypothetical protein